MKSILIIILLSFNFVNAQELPCKASYSNKRCKERYNEDSNGLKHGKCIVYFEDGSVDEVTYYDHGKKHGTCTEFNGWGKYITTFKYGIEDGLYQKVSTDGKILEKGNYANGLKVGYWIEYNGTDKGNYVNGQKHGYWEIYREGWNCEGGITKGNFNNGDPVGTWTNLAVIGTPKASPLQLYPKKVIALPATGGYEALSEYYIANHKSIFDKDGYYVQAFDSNGNEIKPMK